MEALGATRTQAALVERSPARPDLKDGLLTPETIGALLAVLIPENAIVVDEAVSTGHGVPSSRVTTLGEMADAVRRSLASPGPGLIEVVL